MQKKRRCTFVSRSETGRYISHHKRARSNEPLPPSYPYESWRWGGRAGGEVSGVTKFNEVPQIKRQPRVWGWRENWNEWHGWDFNSIDPPPCDSPTRIGTHECVLAGLSNTV